jgi:hypothetical protein
VADSESKREAIEVAARPLRELQKAEHDEIAAAQRALSEAEREHAKAIEQAQHDLRTATEASALAAYSHRVILFHDRISTPAGEPRTHLVGQGRRRGGTGQTARAAATSDPQDRGARLDGDGSVPAPR